MPSYIRVQGDLVQVIDESIRTQTTLPLWIGSMERKVPVSTPRLPDGTLAVYWDPTDPLRQKMLVMVQRPPSVVRLTFRTQHHTVATPFTRFIFAARTSDPDNAMQWRLEDYKIYWSKFPYTSQATADMRPAILPNVYTDGRICFGSTAGEQGMAFADRINQMINEFYSSTFQGDLGINIPNGYRNLAKWAEATTEDPQCWMNWDFLNPQPGQDRWMSWYTACQEISGLNVEEMRADLVTAPNGIPPLSLTPTFARAEEWVDLLMPHQRNALRQALRLPVDPNVPEPNTAEAE